MKPASAIRACAFALVAVGLLAGCEVQPSADAADAVAGRDTRAQPATVAATLVHEGDPARGIPPCAICHGQSGQGSMTAGFPRLAAQPAYYLAHQLDAFADGTRVNAAMTPIARRLGAEERLALGAYYAGERAPSLPAPPPVPGSRGERLAIHGDPELGVPACSSCHGWNGAGNAPHVPFLAGQNQPYLHDAMLAWASGKRDSDPRRQMPAIARALGEGDAEAVAQYFSRLVPPRPLDGPGTVGAGAPVESR